MGNWELSWDSAFGDLTHLVVAYLLAVPIGLNREVTAHSAGLRTFPLVAVGACGFVLVGLEAFPESPESHARIIYGVITGIGFIGGGAILKHNGGVSGTATAASIWITGAIGVAVGWGRIDIALILTGLDIVTLVVGRAIKKRIGAGSTTDD